MHRQIGSMFLKAPMLQILFCFSYALDVSFVLLSVPGSCWLNQEYDTSNDGKLDEQELSVLLRKGNRDMSDAEVVRGKQRQRF